MRAFNDGYDRTVGIREVAGLHPAVEWTYRPLAGPEAAEAYLEFLTAKNKSEAKVAFLAGKISEWRFPDSEDASPEFSKPTPELLLKLNAAAYSKIEQVILGTGVPDYELRDAAEVEGQSDEEQAVADAKNSQAGSAC